MFKELKKLGRSFRLTPAIVRGMLSAAPTIVPVAAPQAITAAAPIATSVVILVVTSAEAEALGITEVNAVSSGFGTGSPGNLTVDVTGAFLLEPVSVTGNIQQVIVGGDFTATGLFTNVTGDVTFSPGGTEITAAPGPVSIFASRNITVQEGANLVMPTGFSFLGLTAESSAIFIDNAQDFIDALTLESPELSVAIGDFAASIAGIGTPGVKLAGIGALIPVLQIYPEAIGGYGKQGSFSPYTPASGGMEGGGAVPEPSTYLMVVLGLGGMIAANRRRKKMNVVGQRKQMNAVGLVSVGKQRS